MKASLLAVLEPPLEDWPKPVAVGCEAVGPGQQTSGQLKLPAPRFSEEAHRCFCRSRSVSAVWLRLAKLRKGTRFLGKSAYRSRRCWITSTSLVLVGNRSDCAEDPAAAEADPFQQTVETVTTVSVTVPGASVPPLAEPLDKPAPKSCIPGVMSTYSYSARVVARGSRKAHTGLEVAHAEVDCQRERQNEQYAENNYNR